MVLSTIGMLLAAGAISRTAEKRTMNAYPTLNKEGYDKHNAIHGINIHDVNKIAARNGVRCDKYGVLPENGWMQCINYVKQYANSPEDVENFPRAWLDGIQKQLDAKHEKIRTEAEKDYKRWKPQWIRATKNKTYQTDVLQLKHWPGLGMTRHQQRVDKIMETDWKLIVARKPILRPIPDTSNSYLEIWEVYQSPRIASINKYKMYYKWFCELCGYDPQL